jgi:hypothetical protein
MANFEYVATREKARLFRFGRFFQQPVTGKMENCHAFVVFVMKCPLFSANDTDGRG